MKSARCSRTVTTAGGHRCARKHSTLQTRAKGTPKRAYTLVEKLLHTAQKLKSPCMVQTSGQMPRCCLLSELLWSHTWSIALSSGTGACHQLLNRICKLFFKVHPSALFLDVLILCKYMQENSGTTTLDITNLPYKDWF